MVGAGADHKGVRGGIGCSIHRVLQQGAISGGHIKVCHSLPLLETWPSARFDDIDTLTGIQHFVLPARHLCYCVLARGKS